MEYRHSPGEESGCGPRGSWLLKLDAVRRNNFPRVSGGASQVFISPTLKEAIEKGFEEAGKMKDEFLSAEHIFLAVAQNVRFQRR